MKLSNNTIGTIVELQTTYSVVDICGTSAQYRIDYHNKKEFFLERDTYVGASIDEIHPLLEEYENTATDLYISSKASSPDAVEQQLVQALDKHFACWRTRDYLNTEYGVLRMLAEGSGLLYRGPPSGAGTVTGVLERNSLDYTAPVLGKPNGEKYKVLFLGKYFVVAEGFNFSVL